jgi:superfamily I DNA/RNA helicase
LAQSAPGEDPVLPVVSGPTRLSGGPGSGKTGLLVQLAADWLGQRRDPHRLVVVTRSRSGGLELRSRLEARLPSAHQLPRILTHEALARTVLTEAGAPAQGRVGLDRVGEWLAMREALRRALPLLERLRPLAEDQSCIEDAIEFVSGMKQTLVGPGLLAERLRDERGLLPELAVITASYEAVLARMGARDTRDLVDDALSRLQADQSLMTGWAELLLVDEAEDLNAAQWYLLRELIQRVTPPHRAVLSGDARVAAPGFKGPSSRFFEDLFPRELTPQELVLDEVGPVWLRRTEEALGLGPWPLPVGSIGLGPASHPPAESAAVVWAAADESEEAFAVAREIQRAKLEGDTSYDQVAVLVRNPRSQLGPLLDAMAVVGVPCRVERTRWSGSLAVQVVLSWLRCLCHPADEVAFLRFLAEGPKGLSPIAIVQLRRAAARRAESLQGALCRELDPTGEDWPEGGKGQTLLEGLVDRASWWRRLGGGNPQLGGSGFTGDGFRALLGEIEIGSGLSELAFIDPDTASALAQLGVAVDDAGAAQLQLGSPETSLLEWVELLQVAVRRGGWDTERLAAPGRSEVSVMTIQQAKGRRWGTVFLVGLVDGTIPSRAAPRGLLGQDESQRLLELVPEMEDAVGGPGHLAEEERRLFLVALTRARDRLILTWAQRYSDQPAERSPFVAQLLATGIAETAAPRADPVTPIDCIAALASMPGARGPTLLPRQAEVLRAQTAELAEMLSPWDPVGAGPVEFGQNPELSATKLRSWLACPRLLYYQLLHLDDGDSVAMALGVAAHRLLELNHQRTDTRSSDAEAFRATAAAIVREELLPDLRSRLLDPLAVLYCDLWLGQLISRWAERVIAPGVAVVGAQVASEMPFSLTRAGWKLVGKVDCLWRHPDGSTEVVDYKTKSGDLPSAQSMRNQVFGKADEGPSDWQLPIYELAARDGAFQEQIGDVLPQLARNWYPGDARGPRSRMPISARGFRIAEPGTKTFKEEAVLTPEELDRVEAELDRQAELIRDGWFPARPRHETGTCRGYSGCPRSRCCDGEGTVGAELHLPLPGP